MVQSGLTCEEEPSFQSGALDMGGPASREARLFFSSLVPPLIRKRLSSCPSSGIRWIENTVPYHVHVLGACVPARQAGIGFNVPVDHPLQFVMLLGVVGVYQQRLGNIQDLLADLLSRRLNGGVGGEACLENNGLGLRHSVNSKQLGFEDWKRK